MEQIAAAKIKIYEFPEVMLLPLLRDKSLLACSPEVSPYRLVFLLRFILLSFRWRMEKRRRGRRTGGWRWDFTRKLVFNPTEEAQRQFYFPPVAPATTVACDINYLYIAPSNNVNESPGTRSLCRGGLQHNNRGGRREEEQRSKLLWIH